MAVEKSGSVMSYEESRKQRVEENKRRMEELGLMDLSKDLQQLKQRNSTKKPLKRKTHSQDDAGLEARRSSRVAAKPAVSYRDQMDLLPGMRARFGTRERQGLPRRYLSDTARMAAIEAAEEVFKDLKNPAFVKAMLHSHVSSCFWLGLPNHFCKKHMPLEDERFILEGKNEQEWECLYLANKTGMSGGWRGFSLDHDLVDGDCCIFELVGPLRFKVHFFRCEETEDVLEEVDGNEMAVKAPGKEKVVKITGKETTTKKKANKAMIKKSKLSKSPLKKLKVEDGEEDEEEDEDDNDDEEDGDYYNSRVPKKGGINAADSSRASRRKLVKEDDNGGQSHAAGRDYGNKMVLNKQKGKKADDLIDLESAKDEDEDIDAWKSPSMNKTNQAGTLDLHTGRATRNSLRRSLPPPSTI